MDQGNRPTNRSFTRWMFRAYLDLGPVPEEAPHHLHGVDFGIRALIEKREFPRIQSALNPSFRDTLIAGARLPEYAVDDPRRLPARLSTSRWESLCSRLESFPSLDKADQARLIWLTAKLCFQRVVLSLLPEEPAEDRIAAGPEYASLAYLRAYSRYRLKIDDRSRPYGLDEFERVCRCAPPGIARIDAHYQMVAQNVKDRGDLEQAEYWQKRHLEAIRDSRKEIGEFDFLFVMSRYHRVGGFLPQMRRDAEGVSREMDLAERYARSLPRGSRVQRIAADEMLYPVLESRTKEALWLDQLDLALERARETVELSPYDARAWLHLGQIHVERSEPESALQAYRRAIRLAPPGKEIACFMAGQCCEALDDLESACDAYLMALEADPLGISAAEQLMEVAKRLGHAAILEWAGRRLEELRKEQREAASPHPEPYKEFAKPN